MRLFGDIRQIGIVVRDIEKAMAHWLMSAHWAVVLCRQAAGHHIPYRGQVVDDFHISVALANSGGTQLNRSNNAATDPACRDFRRRP